MYKTENKRVDFAVIVLLIVQLYSILFSKFMFTSKSRVGERIGIYTKEVFGDYYIFFISLVIINILVTILYFKNRNKFGYIACTLQSIALVFALFMISTYSNIIVGTGNNGRVSPNFGFYLYLMTSIFLMIKFGKFIKSEIIKFIIFIFPIGSTCVLFVFGYMDNLSIIVEYNNRKEQFNIELVKHFLMSFSVMIVGTLIGVPLGLLAYRRPRIGGVVTGFLNTTESIPTMALISLLMLPLAFLNNNFEFLKNIGISGVGGTPVFIALLLYALYHIVNTTYGGLLSVEKIYIEIAKGLGMAESQIFWKVQLPMILPSLISGIRVASISTIIGVTIGSYVGFGGLGMFILQGANGFAIDIIVLVTIPILFVVFLIDFLLKRISVFYEVYYIK